MSLTWMVTSSPASTVPVSATMMPIGVSLALATATPFSVSVAARKGRPLKRAEQFLAADLFVNQQGTLEKRCV